MNKVEEVLKTMTFDFFGSGKHKITPKMFLSEKYSLFLDVRSKEEIETVVFDLSYHTSVMRIPINEIPECISDIPKDKLIGVFCSSGIRSTMVYLYLRASGFENVRIIEGGYAELVEELKPGKLLKHLSSKESVQ